MDDNVCFRKEKCCLQICGGKEKAECQARGCVGKLLLDSAFLHRLKSQHRAIDHDLRRRLHSSSTSVLRISRDDLVKLLVHLALTIEDDTKLPHHSPVAMTRAWTLHVKPRTSSEQASCTVSYRSGMQQACCSGSIPDFALSTPCFQSVQAGMIL